MLRTALTTAIVASLTLGSGQSANAGKPFGIQIGGVKIGAGGGGGPSIKVPGHGNIKIGLPSHRPPVIRPPVRPPVLPGPPIFKPPIVHPVEPPIVVHPPKRPVCKPRPRIVRPKPPIVIHPPVHPPICITPPIVTPPPVYKPITPPTLPCGCEHHCTCQPAYPWRFGMACERAQSPFGVGLRIASITPGGAAQAYGLKVGDVLLVAGTVNLSLAESNEHGVALVQSAVSPEGLVQFTIANGSTGQLAHVTVAPTPTATGPAPTGGPIALNASQPVEAL